MQDGVRDIVGVPGRLACLSDRWWPEPGRAAGVSNFTAAACRIILMGRGLWRLRFRVQSLEAGGAGRQRAPPAVRLGWGGSTSGARGTAAGPEHVFDCDALHKTGSDPGWRH